MQYRKLIPSLVLGAALTVTGCGTDDTADYETVPPATETTAPGAGGTDPATTPDAYDPGPDMTTDTAAWGADTAGLGTTGTTGTGTTGTDTGMDDPNP